MQVNTDLIPAREIINIEMDETELLTAIVDYLVAQGGNLGTKIERVRNDADFHVEMPGTSFGFEVRIESTFTPELPPSDGWPQVFGRGQRMPAAMPGAAAWGQGQRAAFAAPPALQWYGFNGPLALMAYWGEGKDVNEGLADAKIRNQDFPDNPSPPIGRQPTASEMQHIPDLRYVVLTEGGTELEAIAKTQGEAIAQAWSRGSAFHKSDLGATLWRVKHRQRLEKMPMVPPMPATLPMPGTPAATLTPPMAPSLLMPVMGNVGALSEGFMAPPAAPRFYLVEGGSKGLIAERQWLRADSDEQALTRFRNGFVEDNKPAVLSCKVLDRKVDRDSTMYVVNLDRKPS